MYQKLIIAGNLGGEPELKYTPDGKAVCNFSVATSRKVKGKDETVWFRVTVWDKIAETCSEYLHKGSKVLVEGTLKADTTGGPRVFERKDGTWGSSFEVTADSFRFLSGKSDNADSEIPAF